MRSKHPFDRRYFRRLKLQRPNTINPYRSVFIVRMLMAMSSQALAHGVTARDKSSIQETIGVHSCIMLLTDGYTGPCTLAPHTGLKSKFSLAPSWSTCRLYRAKIGARAEQRCNDCIISPKI